MELTKYLKAENVFIKDSYENTESFYADFSLFLKQQGIVNENEKVKRLFIKRENIQSTAIGKGLAAPHIFSDEFGEFTIAVALIKNGIEYKAPDDKKVFLVFLIMSDDRDVGLHLKVLAHIARLAKSTDIIDGLKVDMTTDQLLEYIRSKEALI